MSPTTFHEEQFKTISYRLSTPKIDKTENKAIEKYPLVVYLHGAGERGRDNRKQINGLSFLGQGLSPQARAFRENFPSFVYAPQCPQKASWEGKTIDDVIQTIEHLKSTYPIAPNRLYLIGYSMGGSGTYSLASKYYDFTGQLFAGIIRIAGQSSFDDHVHEIISKSAIWIHIGLQDTPLRVEKAREAYEKLKDIYTTASEKSHIININGKQAKTFTLTIDNQERIKKTEYFTSGHGITHLPFTTPAVFEWLFKQESPRI